MTAVAPAGTMIIGVRDSVKIRTSVKVACEQALRWPMRTCGGLRAQESLLAGSVKEERDAGKT